MQIQMSNLIWLPASLAFAAISEFWFSGFSGHTIYKATVTAVTAFSIAFLIKINNKKLDHIISKLLTLSKYLTCSLTVFYTCGTFLNIHREYLHYKPLIILQQVDAYLNKPIKIDELNHMNQLVNSKASSW